MLLTPKVQKKVVDKATILMEAFHAQFPEPRGPISHYCLFWNAAIVEVLGSMGIRALLQGGTAYWTRIKPEDDLPGLATDWGFKFEWNHETVRAIMQGQLPEMHVWAAIPCKEPEIIDLTTRFWKKRCEDDGYVWTAPEPPEYLWCLGDEMPKGAHYEVSEKGTKLAYQFLLQSQRQDDFFVFEV